MPASNSDKAELAEQIYGEKYKVQFQRDFPGKCVGIDIASKRAFVANGVVEVLQKVADEKIETVIFIKQIGSQHPFFPWHPSLVKEELKAFLDGRALAYVIARQSDPAKTPFLVRKLDNLKQSIPLWSTRASAEAFLLKFREKIKAPNLGVIEVSRADIERFIRSKSNSPFTYAVVEMLP